MPQSLPVASLSFLSLFLLTRVCVAAPVDAVAESVAKIQTQLPSGALVTGAAVCIAPDRLFLTAAHLVHPATRGLLQCEGGEVHPYQVVVSLPQLDMAIVQALETSAEFRSAQVRLEPLQSGSRVTVFGTLDGRASARYSGSLVANNISVSTDACILNDALIVQCAAGPGDSGGAVFDRQGKLVGILISAVNGRPGLVAVLGVQVIAEGLSTYCGGDKLARQKPGIEFVDSTGAENPVAVSVRTVDGQSKRFESCTLHGAAVQSRFDYELALLRWALDSSRQAKSIPLLVDGEPVPLQSRSGGPIDERERGTAGLSIEVRSGNQPLLSGTVYATSGSYKFAASEQPYRLKLQGTLCVPEAGIFRVSVSHWDKSRLQIGDLVSLVPTADAKTFSQYAYLARGCYPLQYTSSSVDAAVEYAIEIVPAAGSSAKPVSLWHSGPAMD